MSFRDQAVIPRTQSVRYQRWIMVRGVLLALPAAFLIWGLIFWFVPPTPDLTDPAHRIAFAWRCCCVVVLLCFLPAIESVAHKRFGSPEIDIIGQRPRQRSDVRFLQHSIEQLLLFIPGLLGLATYCRNGEDMRAVLAATTVWVVSRAMFRIGDDTGARWRGAGLVGMVQSVAILMYVSARFGYDLAGWFGAILPLALVFGLEGYIIMRRGR